MNKFMSAYSRSPITPCSSRLKLRIVIFFMALTIASLALSNSGTTSFDATITMPSCGVAGGNGAGGTGDTIQVQNMDSSIGVLGDGRTWGSHGKRFDLLVTCPGNMSGYNLVQASFQPDSGSGLDPQDNQLLRLAVGSTARHVALALWRADTSIIDLSNSPVVSGPLTGTGSTTTARIALGAIFARTSSAPVAGIATASLPFTLTYE
jgi:major type 1 subunit fimbrin (pilin)